MNYILYNPKAKNGIAEDIMRDFVLTYDRKSITIINVLEFSDYEEFFKTLNSEDEIILFGGDGTLNHFINDIKGLKLPCNVYLYKAGSGNDFINDVHEKVENNRVLLNEYLENLPTVIVNDKEYLFINGIGFGIDGYCCEVGDKLQKNPKKKVNYTAIAIKGLLFHYKRPNAKVTVDNVTREYKKVWLAPTMKGKFYGGGMMVAPNQNRSDGLVTTVVMHKANKLKTLMVFPSIFKGEHIKHHEMVETIVGHEVTVEFDRPTALQIDGETIVGVTKYTVHL